MNKSYIRYVVGFCVMLEGIFLLLSAFVGAFYLDKEVLVYLACGGIYLAIGLLSYFKKPKNNIFFLKDGFMMVALSWVVLSILGAIPFVITKEIPSFIDALFETASGFTTTGSTILNDVEHLSHVSMFWRLFTHWIGGMGILVFVLMILPTAGGYSINILKAESPGPEVDRIVSKVRDSAKWLYFIYIIMTLIEMVLLFISGMSLFDSVVLSFATAGTGGFGVLNSSFGSYTALQQMIAAVFMMLFGVNFNIYYGFFVAKSKDVLKSEELKVYLALVFGATLLIGINILGYYNNGFNAFKDAFFQVTSIISSTGFSSTDFNMWPAFSKTLLVTLMFIGAMAGSTGGGIKVSRIIMIAKDAFRNVQLCLHPRKVELVTLDGKKVKNEVIRNVKSYIGIYACVYIASLLIISLDGFDYTTNFTAVIATLNNIGPGLNIVGPAGNFSQFSDLSKLVLTFDMIAGRLELIPMFVLITPLFELRKSKKFVKELFKDDRQVEA